MIYHRSAHAYSEQLQQVEWPQSMRQTPGAAGAIQLLTAHSPFARATDQSWRKSVKIRSFRCGDEPAVQQLYDQALLNGQIDPLDPALDLDDIVRSYFTHPADHLWVAELHGEIIGLIALHQADRHVAQLRRLLIAPAWRNSELPALLIGVALAHCRHHSVLKVLLDGHAQFDNALELFNGHGYQYARHKNSHGRQMLEFYANLYQRSDADKENRRLSA